MFKTAIITGSSTGIGKSLAFKLSKNKYKIILVARSEEKLELIAKQIKDNGSESLIVPADLSKPESILQIKAKVKLFGDVSLVINNAGMGKFDKIEDVSLNDWNDQIDINLRSAFLVSQLFVPNMKIAKTGMLVFINSVAGKKAYPFSAAYSASKFGLKGLADSFREELRAFNIKVISVFPGAVDTPFWNDLNVDFPRNEMLNVDSLAESILHTINAPGNLTVEEMVLRRTKGDF